MKRCIHMKGAMDVTWLTEAMPDARRAEEMFEDGPGGVGAALRNGAARKPAPRRRGAVARAR